MTQYILGRVAPVYKGAFDVNTEYVRLDVVFYNGSSYIAKKTTIQNLPTDTTNWLILAKAGTWDSFSEEEKAELVEILTPIIEDLVDGKTINYSVGSKNYNDYE